MVSTDACVSNFLILARLLEETFGSSPDAAATQLLFHGLALYLACLEETEVNHPESHLLHQLRKRERDGKPGDNESHSAGKGW
jgi:hypothetical protein